jgi:hypothetical protein
MVDNSSSKSTNQEKINALPDGPWSLECVESPGQGEWHYWRVVGPKGVITFVSAVAQRGPIDMASNEGNARAIAALPELIEAARRLIDKDNTLFSRHDCYGWKEVVDAISAALKKADGQ